MNIVEILNKIDRIGCDKVLTSNKGTSVPYKNAIEEFNIDVELIFIRDDGWTLGCHRTMMATAYHLWLKKWTYVLIKPMSHPVSIESFLQISTDDLNKILPLINI